ncbi:MarR family winged helix-turn-helix transcriptional regulator [Clostridium sp.]|uniref:MarR family winged helix-turn-helix transcriptional regulator n=1 Tax=Clostridium sp. TaxID=1506 RepID=UPI001A4E9273|nr:MarR family transcriptional regulator [Clostridium sp.]MBK5239642.1 MarR family transcriptional regulator [Clostridium sp.]
MKNKTNYDDLNSLNLRVLITLSRTTQTVHKRSGQIFREGGHTTAQFAVLEVLYHKGPLSVGQIIESILSTAGNMTVVINNLEKEGLIKRYPNPEDKRSYIIEITESGKTSIQSIFPKHLDDLEKSFGNLTGGEKNVLISLLKKIK